MFSLVLLTVWLIMKVVAVPWLGMVPGGRCTCVFSWFNIHAGTTSTLWCKVSLISIQYFAAGTVLQVRLGRGSRGGTWEPELSTINQPSSIHQSIYQTRDFEWYVLFLPFSSSILPSLPIMNFKVLQSTSILQKFCISHSHSRLCRPKAKRMPWGDHHFEYQPSPLGQIDRLHTLRVVRPVIAEEFGTLALGEFMR